MSSDHLDALASEEMTLEMGVGTQPVGVGTHDLEKWVWLPDKKEVWLPAKVLEHDRGVSSFELLTGEKVEKRTDEVKELEDATDMSVHAILPNLVDLDDFGEGAILHQLRQRYCGDQIYTNIGSILVSINPYKQLTIYGSAAIDTYRAATHQKLPPHVFQVASNAYRGLINEKKNQAVAISGESGAGKTEATKLILQFLSEVAGSDTGVEQEILHSNPLLEAFGNAKTVRNNNSSRFGKWMEIHFTGNHRIAAARIVNYLLEKSRVVYQAKGERNYHVLYQIFHLPPQLLSQLNLSDPRNFHFLNQSGEYTVEDVSDVAQLALTTTAMHRLNFGMDEIKMIWRVLASVLNLGNIVVEADPKSDGSIISNEQQLAALASIMQLEKEQLKQGLLYRKVTIAGESHLIPLKPHEAVFARDALAKAIYGFLFDWLIRRVNMALGKVQTPLRIGVLDIFGFEIFDLNLFEQFCINYANEKLQQHFNNFIFKLEQSEYKEEGINVKHIEFVDNQECLNLVERPRVGIIAMLNEEVTVPNGNDTSLLQKMHTRFNKKERHRHYDIIRRKPTVFVINHYAGPVLYESHGMVVKNRDKLHDFVVNFLMQSGCNLIVEIFKAGQPQTEAQPSGRHKKRAVRTVLSEFHRQLQSLMAALGAAEPHFVRCIKPNSQKTSDLFDSDLVLRQLKYAGLFEAIRIRRLGYPFRQLCDTFVKRFGCLVAGRKDVLSHLRADSSAVGQCKILLSALEAKLDMQDITIGRTKVFMRATQRSILNELREKALTAVVIQLQTFFRRVNAERLLRKMKQVNDKARLAIKSRDAEMLAAVLNEAEENFVEIFVLKEVETLHKFVVEEKNVVQLLKTSLESNTLEVLQGALDRAAKLLVKFSDIAASPSTEVLVNEAKERKVNLLRRVQARKQLQDSLFRENIPELRKALSEAKEAGVEDKALLEEASTLLETLEQEEAAFVRLDAAIQQPERAELEAAIAGTVGLSIDANRKKKLKLARTLLFKQYTTLLTTAQGDKDEKAVLEFIKTISSLVEKGFPELKKVAVEAQEWLDGEAERRKMAEERKRQMEEAKKKKDKTARERLEAEERKVHEEEDARRDELRANAKKQEESQKRIKEMARFESSRARVFERKRSFILRGEAIPQELQEEEALIPPPPPPEAEDEVFDVAPPPPSPSSGDLPPPAFDPSHLEEEKEDTRHRRLGTSVREEHMSEQLGLAMRRRSLKSLKRLLRWAEDNQDTNSRLFRQAQRVQKRLEMEEVVFEKVRMAIEELDREAMVDLLREANALLISTDAPIIVKARDLCYGISDSEFLTLKLKAALKQHDRNLILPLLEEAKRTMVDNETVAEAAQFAESAVPVLMGFTPMAAKRRISLKKDMLGGASAEYAEFVQMKRMFPLSKFPFLRREGNYAKRQFFRKKNVKRNFLVWQKEVIPRSLFKLSAKHCEGRKPSQMYKKMALSIFKNIQGYMTDTFHQYPNALAHEICQLGLGHPAIRDEIFCQLIKQTTGNPSQYSLLRGFKLLFICLLTFVPSNELSPFLLSHIAAHAPAELDATDLPGMEDPAGLAANIFFCYRDRQANGAAALPPPIHDIDAITNGFYESPFLERLVESLSATPSAAAYADVPNSAANTRLSMSHRSFSFMKRRKSGFVENTEFRRVIGVIDEESSSSGPALPPPPKDVPLPPPPTPAHTLPSMPSMPKQPPPALPSMPTEVAPPPPPGRKRKKSTRQKRKILPPPPAPGQQPRAVPSAVPSDAPPPPPTEAPPPPPSSRRYSDAKPSVAKRTAKGVRSSRAKTDRAAVPSAAFRQQFRGMQYGEPKAALPDMPSMEPPPPPSESAPPPPLFRAKTAPQKPPQDVPPPLPANIEAPPSFAPEHLVEEAPPSFDPAHLAAAPPMPSVPPPIPTMPPPVATQSPVLEPQFPPEPVGVAMPAVPPIPGTGAPPIPSVPPPTIPSVHEPPVGIPMAPAGIPTAPVGIPTAPAGIPKAPGIPMAPGIPSAPGIPMAPGLVAAPKAAPAPGGLFAAISGGVKLKKAKERKPLAPKKAANPMDELMSQLRKRVKPEQGVTAKGVRAKRAVTVQPTRKAFGNRVAPIAPSIPTAPAGIPTAPAGIPMAPGIPAAPGIPSGPGVPAARPAVSQKAALMAQIRANKAKNVRQKRARTAADLGGRRNRGGGGGGGGDMMSELRKRLQRQKTKE